MVKEEDRKKRDHLIFYFYSKVLIFNDVRKFGFIKYYDLKELNDSKHLKDMGPEPFQMDLIQTILKKKLKKMQCKKPTYEPKICCWLREYLLFRNFI